MTTKFVFVDENGKEIVSLYQSSQSSEQMKEKLDRAGCKVEEVE